jgi:hypothetical protein
MVEQPSGSLRSFRTFSTPDPEPPPEAMEIDLIFEKHNPFTFQQCLLSVSPSTAERNHSFCIDNPVPWYVGAGWKVVERISHEPLLPVKAAELRHA